MFFWKSKKTISEKKPVLINQERIIKCPYCFKEFRHDKVHFKAMTLKEGNDWGNADDNFGDKDDNFNPLDEEDEKKEKQALFTEIIDAYYKAEKEREAKKRADNKIKDDEEDFNLDDEFEDSNLFDEEEDFDFLDNNEGKNSSEISIEELFKEKEDLQFKNFWNEFTNELSWQYKNYPVITENDTRMMTGTYHRDADGMVDSVKDFYGIETRERIYPYCHNPLPPNYGKYKVHFISTVGITSSGKTVYLSQLLKGMDEYMTRVGLVTFDMTPENEQFLKENQVERDVPLPRGTVPGSLSIPLFYLILNENEYHTLVFYDVAGENCIIPEEMNKYAPFIKNADGIIMILDPNQFNVVNQSEDKVAKTTAVIQAMFHAFLGTNSTVKSNIPLALALSKSDKLEKQNLIKSNSNIIKDIVYDGRQGFDVQQYYNLMGEVRKFLNGINEGRTIINSVGCCFSQTGLFAFSALNCDIKEEEQIIDGKPQIIAIPTAPPVPRRIEEPLFWLMAEFGIIQKLKPGQH